MAGSCDNVKLLLSCKVDELNSVSGNTDREVCILLFFRMLHSIDKFLFTEYVYIEVMCTTVKVSVKYIYKVLCTLFLRMTKSIRVDSLSIGDSVKGILIVKLCNRVQGSKKSVLLCAVRRVCSRCQRLAGFSSVRKRSCSFTINNIGCDGKDGCGWLGITIGMDVFQLLKECGKQGCCDLVCSVIIVTITWEVTLNLEVCCDSVLVTDCFYFCIFDSGKGIYYV